MPVVLSVTRIWVWWVEFDGFFWGGGGQNADRFGSCGVLVTVDTFFPLISIQIWMEYARSSWNSYCKIIRTVQLYQQVQWHSVGHKQKLQNKILNEILVLGCRNFWSLRNREKRGICEEILAAVQWRYLENPWLLSPAMWFTCPVFLTQKGQSLVTSVTRIARTSTSLATCTVANWPGPRTSATKTVTRGSSTTTTARSAGSAGSCSRSRRWSSRRWGGSGGSMRSTATKGAPLSAGVVHNCIHPLSRGPTPLCLQSQAKLETAWTWARDNENPSFLAHSRLMPLFRPLSPFDRMEL